MLVDLNISVWTGRKMDKKVSDEIDASKNTKAKAGNYHKKLLAGTDKLDAIQSLTSTIRLWHHVHTLPWSDGGSRLLPVQSFFEYKPAIAEFEQKFYALVEEFLAEYPTLVSAAAFQLGDLFNSNDYPPVSELRSKFRFRYVFMPVPTSGDFRIDIEDASRKDLEEQYTKFYADKLSEAMKDVWERLHDCLSHMSDKLAGEEKQLFRDSLVENAVELCGVLGKLNVANDLKLEDARQKLERALMGVSAVELRKHNDLRKDVKAKVDEILSMF
jgi:hypothetical protein